MTSDQYKYLNIQIKWPGILFVFVAKPFPELEYIRMFIW